MAFVAHTPLPSSDGAPSALDFSSLNSLKRGVQKDPNSEDKQREVARQFEAMFIQLLMKQARQTADQMPSLFDSQATRMARSLSDEQTSLALANPGIGLADALMAQMRGGVLNQPLDPLANPPEAARSRLPGLQSRIGEGRRQVADSISSLIDLLSQRNLGQKVRSAIQGAPDHIRSFVDQMAAAADVAARRSGVPAKLILSQAALESGWGQREILRPDGSTSHNLFGIKAGGNWRGDVVRVMTTEYVDGEPRRMLQPFRAYDSYADSFTDYANLISKSDRYSDVMTARSAEDAARKVQAAGYATDPSYADKLISIMGYFNAR
ncbi:flagellar assembly peptidoglycan hydrolase FlgJ [uncultured Castellaniella sp.]|uniref:flagellar assembly peptidoglycan hydrolase FlgJ n=1 Tax=uncultured Castellaniella sp. TaxID=647907 RepID=UPI0026056572|nr:flagellar assembly peptidoglycan hydrolase FlgJ [uncultured Castellaniella sp.]